MNVKKIFLVLALIVTLVHLTSLATAYQSGTFNIKAKKCGDPVNADLDISGRQSWSGNLGYDGQISLTFYKGNYNIVVNYQGDSLSRSTYLSCSETENIQFNFPSSQKLIIKAVDSNGQPLNAFVKVRGRNKDWEGNLGANGRVSLNVPAGDYDLYSNYQGDNKHKQVSVGCDRSKTVKFNHDTCEKPSLTVRTKDEYGNGVNARVSIDGPESKDLYTGHDGQATNQVKTGRYQITAEYERQTKTKFATLGCGDVRNVDFTFRTAEEDTEEDTEEECEDASLTLRATKGRGVNVDAQIKIRGPDDRTFNLGPSGFRTVKLEPGAYDVTAEHEGQSISRRIELDCGQSRQKDFSFRSCEDASLTLETTDQEGGRVDAHVDLKGPDDRSVRTGSGGLRTLNLKPGAYDVVAKYDGKTRSRHTKLDCGQSRRLVFSFSQCQDSTLTIRTMKQEGEGVNAYVKLRGPRNRVFYIGEGGLRTLNLPAGDYDIISKYQGQTKSKHICLGCGSSQVCGVSEQINFRFDIDSDAPRISNLQPTGEIDCGADVELRAETDESASCAYAEQSFSFASGTIFSQTRGTYHTTRVSTEPGQDYDYYIKCRDREDNTNQNAARVHFSCKKDTTQADCQNNVKVIVRDGEERVKNARVSLENVEGIVEKVAYTNFDGKAIFTNLPHGLYLARADKDGYQVGENGGFVEGCTTSTIHVELGKEELDLNVMVRGPKGGRLRRARVKVRSMDDEYSDSARTNSFGRADFPDLKRGSYDIRISKYGYESMTDTIRLTRSREVSYMLSKEEDEGEEGEEVKGNQLRIRSIIFPDKVPSCSQQQLKVKVKNTPSSSQEVRVKAKVLGETYSSNNAHVLRRGQEKWFEIPITIPSQAGGAESLQIIASSEDNRRENTISFEVRQVHASININPSPVTVGEQVQVYGFLSASDIQAEIYLNDQRMTGVVSDSSGYYETYIRPYRSGKTSIELKLSCGDTLARKQLTVKPNLTLGVQWPERVAVGEQFEVCAEAKAQYGARVHFLKNGKAVQSRKMRSQEERICFKTSLLETGPHDLSFKLGSLTKTGQVTAIEPKTEVRVFPQDLQLSFGGSGVIRVRLCNSGLVAKTYRVGVSGFDPAWISSPVDTVTLQSGECKELFLHVNPHEVGNYHGSVKVMTNSHTIEEKFIELYVPARARSSTSLFSNIFGALNAYLVYILASILLFGISYGLYRGFFLSQSLEPRYK